MAVRRTKVKEGELLTAINIEKVIELLNPEEGKPITKKSACEILNITYNTTRLNNILEEYESDKIFKRNMRKKMRNTPIDISTASQIVSGYLSGTSLADLSEITYRSTNVVKNVLNKYNVPVRSSSVDYFNPVYLESDVQDYVEGDLVYSARYDKPATVRKAVMDERYGMVYTCWLHGIYRKQIVQPYYELADLRRVQTELNIKMEDMEGTSGSGEIGTILQGAMKNQKKQEDKRK